MGKKIVGNDGPVLGLNSSADMFEKLKFESVRLKEGWHPYDAFNFLLTAKHLIEWRTSYDSVTLCDKRDKKQLPELMQFLFQILSDLANGSKHFQLKAHSVKSRVVTEVHIRQEADFYDWFFQEDMPGVTVAEYSYFSIRILHNLMMRYFEWTFDDLTPVKEFPNDIIDTISYCNIATRSGPAPALWLL